MRKNNVFNYNIVNIPAATVGTGMFVAIEVTRELVGICDIVVDNLLAVTVGIGVLVTIEVTSEVIGVYDTVVIPTG